jgi:hypothetical protein
MSKEWIIKRPDSTQFVSNDDMIKILVDMHGAIDDSAILINTERILVGLSSLYSCTLSEHSLKNGFDSIVPLTIHSKNHIIPDILLSRKGEYDIIDDDTKITINNEFSDKLTDLFKESDVRLSDLLREIIKMFPEKIVYIKFTSCMDFNGAFESYTKCYNRIYTQPDTVISKSENIIMKNPLENPPVGQRG